MVTVNHANIECRQGTLDIKFVGTMFSVENYLAQIVEFEEGRCISC